MEVARRVSCSHARDLEALRSSLAQLAARVLTLEQQTPRRATDLELLAAIAAATQGRAFSALELHHHAQLVDRDLYGLLHGVGADTPRKLGKALERLSRVTAGAYRLLRVTRDAQGTVWACSVGESHLHAGSRTDAGRGV